MEIMKKEEQIKVLWESGMPMARIQRLVAMPICEFRKLVAKMRENGDLSKERETTATKVCAAFDRGERNVRAIAERLGLAEITVRKYLRANGRFLGKKTRIWKHSARTLAIVDDFKDGELTLYRIAKNHGVSLQYVSKLYRKWQKGILDYECLPNGIS